MLDAHDEWYIKYVCLYISGPYITPTWSTPIPDRPRARQLYEHRHSQTDSKQHCIYRIVAPIRQLKHFHLSRYVDINLYTLGNLADHRQCNFGLHLQPLDSSHKIIKSVIPRRREEERSSPSAERIPTETGVRYNGPDIVLDAGECLGRRTFIASVLSLRGQACRNLGGKDQAQIIPELS